MKKICLYSIKYIYIQSEIFIFNKNYFNQFKVALVVNLKLVFTD